MIIDNKYKVTWSHYNKDRDVDMPKETMKDLILNLVEKSKSKEMLMDNITEFLEEKPRYDKSHSRCSIFELVDDGWFLIADGLAIVHPNDKFNRKKGVFESLKNATLQTINGEEDGEHIIPKKIRSIIWEEFWKIREKPKASSIEVEIDGDMNLKTFLNLYGNKLVWGDTIVYTLPTNSNIIVKVPRRKIR